MAEEYAHKQASQARVDDSSPAADASRAIQGWREQALLRLRRTVSGTDVGLTQPGARSGTHSTTGPSSVSPAQASIAVSACISASYGHLRWTSDAHVKKMQMGGNAKARAFFEQSPEYSKTMSISEKYNTHFAAQYRDKLQAEVDGKAWDPSMTPVPSEAATGGLRKPRTSTPRSGSPAPVANGGANRPLSPGSVGAQSNPYKAQNEAYFAGLGSANASRSEALRPSEGGKYAGFGSAGSYNPSEATSSRALPSLEDVTQDPLSALNKGWGFFSAALSQAGKTINENVIKPAAETVQDPNFQNTVRGYAASAATVVGQGARQGGALVGSGLRSTAELARQQGLDVGDAGAGWIEKTTGANRPGYQSVSSLSQQEAGVADNHFFAAHGAGYDSNPAPAQHLQPATTSAPTSGRSTPIGGRRTLGAAKAKPKADDEWESWS